MRRMNLEHRGKFSGKLGFILAAAGSAVGLGNIWRFPYLVAEYGGGIFLLIYLILVISFGYTLMVTEIAIGRKTGLSPIGAFEKISKKFKFVGIFAVATVFLISTYYNVIGGWILKYCAVFLTGGAGDAMSPDFFGNYTSQSFAPLIWQMIFIAAISVVLIGGVKGGIEKISRILMPVLVVMSVIVAIYAMTLPGALEGVKYVFIPDFSKFSFETVLAAMGQMFYSMSLAMGIMITYGSYLNKEENISRCVSRIEIFDTFIAICAGLMIIPAVFAFSGGNTEALNSGPSLLFITLPNVFGTMPFGTVMGALFFILVLFAALTSAISILEVVTASLCDLTGMRRRNAAILVSVVSFVLGIPSSLGFGLLSGVTILDKDILTFIDYLANSIALPVVGLSTCILIGYVSGIKTVVDEVELSGEFKRKKLYTVMIKYVAPIFLAAILISSLFGIV